MARLYQTTFSLISKREAENSIDRPRSLCPRDSRQYAIQTLYALKRLWDSTQTDIKWWKEEVELAKKAKIWTHFGVPNLDALLVAEIGLTENEAATAMRQRAVDHAKETEGKKFNKGAGPLSKEEKGNGHIMPIKSAGHGTNADYLTARIARDRPDILARMKAGEFKSVRQAAIAAGIVKVLTPFQRAQKAFMRLAENEKIVFLRWARGGRP